MVKSITIIQEFLNSLIKFSDEKKREPRDLREFTAWMSNSIFCSPIDEQHSDKIKDINLELTFLLSMQSKRYKMLCKKVFYNTELKTPDDYSFLYHLSLADSFRKMELVNIHLLEAPSGIEVLKRLLNKQLTEEYDDADDKRAKRVRITTKGKKLINQLAPQMENVYSQMTSDLNSDDKLHLKSIMGKFNIYH